MKSLAVFKGWTNKPTPRSETERFRSKVLKFFGNVEEALFSAIIVTMFNTMAVKHKRELKTQLITNVE